MPPEIRSLARSTVACCAAVALAAFVAACEQPLAAEPAPAEPVAKPRPAPPVQAAPAPRADAISAAATSDSAITARVRDALVRDPALAGADLSVNTDHGVVNLTGTVRSQEQAAIAAAHAQGQDGVMRIDNHLSIVPQ